MLPEEKNEEKKMIDLTRGNQPVCSYDPCDETLRSKFDVAIGIGPRQFIYCGLDHFKSDINRVEIRQKISPVLEVVSEGLNDQSPVVGRCSSLSCSRNASELVTASGKGQRRNFLRFCSLSCLLDKLALIRQGTWKSMVRTNSTS